MCTNGSNKADFYNLCRGHLQAILVSINQYNSYLLDYCQDNALQGR